MAKLLHRVGGIRNQLAEEDLLVGVKRVNDQIEQLLDLGLKGVFFGGRCAHGLIKLIGKRRARYAGIRICQNPMRDPIMARSNNPKIPIIPAP